MRVVITGGGGFLGQMLAKRIIANKTLLANTKNGAKHTAVTQIQLVDVHKPNTFLFPELQNSMLNFTVGDVADPNFCKTLFDGNPEALSLFHLGAVMSGQGETDFDLCMNTNLHGSLNILEAARQSNLPRPKLVFASAGATLGTGDPRDFVSADELVGDWTRATPHTTYGMTKACAELLLSDYNRRAFVDGRGCRLPTVIVRAGAPNGATTGCFSAAVRDPLAGKPFVAPLSADVPHGVTGARTAAECLFQMHELSEEKADSVLGFERTVWVPSIVVTLRGIREAMERVIEPSSHGALGASSYDETDSPFTRAIASFPSRIDCKRAKALGLPSDADVETIIREYCEDFGSALDSKVRVRTMQKADPTMKKDSHTVVLITGGGTGIGRTVALRLSKGGWMREEHNLNSKVVVVLTGRRREPLEETAKLISEQAPDAIPIVAPADLTREQDVDTLFQIIRNRYGRLDLLFNNAGSNVKPTVVGDMSLKDWKSVVDINLNAAFHVAREAYRLMSEQAPMGGRIINNGSISAQTPRPGSVAYTASKHAITGLTKTIALDGRASNIACGQIDYGNVVSAISAQMATGMPQPDGSMRPEPRMSPEDAADMVYNMASLPLSANVLNMTVIATHMPFVGRG